MKFLTTMPKEKLQKLILVVILTLIGVGAVLNFYARKQFSELSAKKEEIAKLTQQIEGATEAIKQEVSNTELREELQAFVDGQTERMVTGDPYSWVVREMSLLAEKRPIRVIAVSPGSKGQHPENGQYETYTVRMEVEGAYDNLGRFIRDLENQYPTGGLRGLTLSAGEVGKNLCRASFEVAFMVCPLSEDKRDMKSQPDSRKDA